MKESSDLENIGPPSFLDEANLDSSLTNIEEIMEYPPGKNQKGKITPKQKRNEIKNRSVVRMGGEGISKTGLFLFSFVL